MKQITAYRCDHCKRVMVTPRAMKAHEAQCIRNPRMGACATCEHDRKGFAQPDEPGCSVGCRPIGVAIVRACQDWEPAEGYATD